MHPLELIRGVGVELEGGDWPDEFCDDYWKSDCSVECGGWMEGEFASHVFRSSPEIEEWVTNVWPGTFDDSCGMHVHISVNVADYCRLMEPEFDLAFRQAMIDFAAGLDEYDERVFTPRFDGDNEYCYPDFEPDTRGSRYRQLNYSAFLDHGTLECRLFPMFPSGPETAIEAIDTFITCVEEYLASHDETLEWSVTSELDSDLIDQVLTEMEA